MRESVEKLSLRESSFRESRLRESSTENLVLRIYGYGDILKSDEIRLSERYILISYLNSRSFSNSTRAMSLLSSIGKPYFSCTVSSVSNSFTLDLPRGGRG